MTATFFFPFGERKSPAGFLLKCQFLKFDSNGVMCAYTFVCVASTASFCLMVIKSSGDHMCIVFACVYLQRSRLTEAINKSLSETPSQTSKVLLYCCMSKSTHTLPWSYFSSIVRDHLKC